MFMYVSWFFGRFGALTWNFTILGQLRKEVKYFYVIRHDIKRTLVQIKNILRCFCIVYMCFLIFQPFWGINIRFCNFRAITKRSKFLFDYSSRYSKVIRASQKKLSYFLYCLCVLLDFWSFFRYLRNIRLFG